MVHYRKGVVVLTNFHLHINGNCIGEVRIGVRGINAAILSLFRRDKLDRSMQSFLVRPQNLVQFFVLPFVPCATPLILMMSCLLFLFSKARLSAVERHQCSSLERSGAGVIVWVVNFKNSKVFLLCTCYDSAALSPESIDDRTFIDCIIRFLLSNTHSSVNTTAWGGLGAEGQTQLGMFTSCILLFWSVPTSEICNFSLATFSESRSAVRRGGE